MLNVCAPGFTWRLATHCRIIAHKDKTYRSFPKQDNIEIGHVRKLARFLGVLDCAKEHIPSL